LVCVVYTEVCFGRCVLFRWRCVVFGVLCVCVCGIEYRVTVHICVSNLQS
jgi:hypothetical protein